MSIVARAHADATKTKKEKTSKLRRKINL